MRYHAERGNDKPEFYLLKYQTEPLPEKYQHGKTPVPVSTNLRRILTP